MNGGTTGCFTSATNEDSNYSHAEWAQAWTVTMNASRSSNIYGAASTVQPPTLQLIPQIHFWKKGGDSLKAASAGLPNIVGKIKNNNDGYAVNAAGGNFANFKNNGCYTFEYATGTSIIAEVTSANVLTSINFNAAQCNPIYGNSDTVQPPAIQLIPQIKY